MESQIEVSPDGATIEELVTEAKRRNACVSIYARCEVLYDGRADASLSTGDRLILYKQDGSVGVHTEAGPSPTNWQTAGARLRVPETDPLTITSKQTDPDEILKITCEEVYHATLMPMDDYAELNLRGSESDLQDYIYDNPEVIEDGFRSVEKERETKAGPVDIWGYDVDGEPVLLELKRRTAGPDDVDQLRRYIDHLDMDVRGILVAPSFSDRSLELLSEHGLEYREVEPPSAGRETHHTLADF